MPSQLPTFDELLEAVPDATLGVDASGCVAFANARAEDLDVNAIKEKHLTNMRSSTSDVLVRLVPPRRLSLDQALEFVREDECVEVTPESVRLRKVELDGTRRHKLARNRAKDRLAPA